MGAPPKARSRKEQLQLDRRTTEESLRRAVARDQTGTLTTVTFFVVSTLLTYMGEEGEAFPSMDTLARAVGMNERTVRDHLGCAVAAGFLLKRRDGKRKTNVYLLNPALLPRPGKRANTAGHSGEVTGSAAPVTRSMTAGWEGVVDSAKRDTESAHGYHLERVTGSSAPSERVSGGTVTGAADPTIHLEEIHEEEPRTKNLVRSSFGRSDDCCSEERIEELTTRIFHQTHGVGRARSRKTRIARALRKLAGERVDLEAAARGTIAAMHGPDAYNDDLDGHQAAEKILRSRRWESWLVDDRPGEVGDVDGAAGEDDWTAFI